MDWIGVSLSIGGMWLLPQHYYWAIGLFIISNFVWIGYALRRRIWSIVSLQVVFFALNVRAWLEGA